MADAKSEKVYVFIPGAWHGHWVFDPITSKLQEQVKTCLSLTLPGIETQPEIQEIINLDTHIRFVTEFLTKRNITNVILCGHSYAGLVITGVADKIPERIHALVYIDAYIPKDGDSCWSLTSEEYRQRFVTGARHDGFHVAVPPGLESRRRPHPLASLMQSLKLSGNYRKIYNKAFIYLTGWEGSPFVTQFEALKDSSDWQIETIHSAHNVMRDHPDKLVKVLLDMEKKFK